MPIYKCKTCGDPLIVVELKDENEISRLTSLAHRMLQALEITSLAYEEIEIDDVIVSSFDFLRECKSALKENKL